VVSFDETLSPQLAIARPLMKHKTLASGRGNKLWIKFCFLQFLWLALAPPPAPSSTFCGFRKRPSRLHLVLLWILHFSLGRVVLWKTHTKQVSLMLLLGQGVVGKRQIPSGKKKANGFYGRRSLKFHSQRKHVLAYSLCNGVEGRE